MSKPKRYLCAFGIEGVMQPFQQGDWVTYSDYAALQAENERLRKAGDAMASQITYESQMADDDWGVDTGTPKNVQAWLAAKGVQP